MKLIIALCLCLVKLCFGDLPDLRFVPCPFEGLQRRECLRRSFRDLFRISDHPVPYGAAPVTRKPMPKDSISLGPGGKSFAAQLFLNGVASFNWMNSEIERLILSSNYAQRTHNMSVKAFSPSVTLNGTYKGPGHILNKPVNRGTILIILENFQWQWDAHLKLAKINGTQHWTRIASTANVNEPEKTKIFLYYADNGGISPLKVDYETLFSELKKDFDYIVDKLLLRMYDIV